MVFAHDHEDFEQEIEAVAKSARFSARRIDIRYGIVTDRSLIKKYKKTTNWFPDASLNSIVLRRYDGETMRMDLNNAI